MPTGSVSGPGDNSGHRSFDDPSINSLSPAVSPAGVQAPDTELTCSTGTWGDLPVLSYQWQDDGADIVGETAITYTPGAALSGHEVTCVVTATNDGGIISATSNAVTIS